MSDYMFILESHLTPAQRQVVADVEAAGAQTDDQVFLTGGAMRDMLGGFPIGDLDFTVQGNALGIARKVAKATGATIVATDRVRKSTELLFPSGVTAEIAMARTERFTRPGARPKVAPATIHEDLVRRDFTINAIALSLHPASRGLLLDPCNGLADLEHRELRATSNYSFYDDPVRLLRFVRFRVRLGFGVDERTRRQYENAREAEVERSISSAELLQELRCIADQVNAGEVLEAMENENLLHLFSPALAGAKLNLGMLNRLQRARLMIPYGLDLHLNNLGIFLYCLTDKLTPAEKSSFIKNLKMGKSEVELWKKLPARSQPLEKDLQSRMLHRPSELYQRLLAATGDQTLFLYLYSSERIVHDRIRNFLQKYAPLAQEITVRDVTQATGLETDDLAFERIKNEMVAAKLDGRKWTPPAPVREQKPKKRAAKKAAKAVSRAKAVENKPAGADSGVAPAGEQTPKQQPAVKSARRKVAKTSADSKDAGRAKNKRAVSAAPSKAKAVRKTTGVTKVAKPARQAVKRAAG